MVTKAGGSGLCCSKGKQFQLCKMNISGDSMCHMVTIVVFFFFFFFLSYWVIELGQGLFQVLVSMPNYKA